MDIAKNILMVFIGFSSGVVISGGVFAFINAMGIVSRMAVKTKTKEYLRTYEDAITLGGIFSAVITLFRLEFHLPNIIIILYALFIGIFMGVLAVALAEVLNVVPIIMRRMRINMGLPVIVISLALGKSVGAIIYFFWGGFFEP